jgi:metallo-beta-lactamase family protein
MPPPHPLDEIDYLVLESTYGDRKHPDIEVEKFLAETANRTFERNGLLLVPSFAVGRAQSLMYLFNLLMEKKRIPEVPMYLNSPMAVDATELFERHTELHKLSDEQVGRICRNVQFVNSISESKALNQMDKPAIIISASGMATGGRVIHHIKAHAPKDKNTLMFAGFQAAGTRGQAIVNGAEKVKIHGEYIPINCEVAQLEALSAHADHVEIGDWLETRSNSPRDIFLTHGEPAATDAQRLYLKDRFGWRPTIPDLEDSVELTRS